MRFLSLKILILFLKLYVVLFDIQRKKMLAFESNNSVKTINWNRNKA